MTLISPLSRKRHKHLFVVGLTLIATGFIEGDAAAQSTTTEDLLQCDRIKDSEDRLACFNTVVEKLKEDPKAFSRSSDQDANRNDLTRNTRPRQETAAEFGRKKRNIKRVNKLTTNIRRQWRDQYGRWVFFLDNGQVWREDIKGSINIPKNPQSVRIKRGLIGGYLLKVIGSSTNSRLGAVSRLD